MDGAEDLTQGVMNIVLVVLEKNTLDRPKIGKQT